ncbi:MAG: TetR family transcriptional regulator [Actinomycetota bacterium]|nr:TetR family transcriptional regulator [Actinomycetota bacterium]
MPPPPTTREGLLAAAYDAAVAGDWDRVRMADVATAAGVSRQTLYNEFGTKDALAAALALREADAFLDGTDALLRDHAGTPSQAVEAAVLYTLDRAADNRLLKAVLTLDPALLPFLTTRAEPLLVEAHRRITEFFLGHWPALSAADVDLVAETTVRLTVSHLVMPTEPAATTAARIALLVSRYLAEGAL